MEFSIGDTVMFDTRLDGYPHKSFIYDIRNHGRLVTLENVISGRYLVRKDGNGYTRGDEVKLTRMVLTEKAIFHW